MKWINRWNWIDEKAHRWSAIRRGADRCLLFQEVSEYSLSQAQSHFISPRIKEDRTPPSRRPPAGPHLSMLPILLLVYTASRVCTLEVALQGQYFLSWGNPTLLVQPPHNPQSREPFPLNSDGVPTPWELESLSLQFSPLRQVLNLSILGYEFSSFLSSPPSLQLGLPKNKVE